MLFSRLGAEYHTSEIRDSPLEGRVPSDSAPPPLVCQRRRRRASQWSLIRQRINCGTHKTIHCARQILCHCYNLSRPTLIPHHALISLSCTAIHITMSSFIIIFLVGLTLLLSSSLLTTITCFLLLYSTSITEPSYPLHNSVFRTLGSHCCTCCPGFIGILTVIIANG
jgi:hypothetical protein